MARFVTPESSTKKLLTQSHASAYAPNDMRGGSRISIAALLGRSSTASTLHLALATDRAERAAKKNEDASIYNLDKYMKDDKKETTSSTVPVSLLDSLPPPPPSSASHPIRSHRGGVGVADAAHTTVSALLDDPHFFHQLRSSTRENMNGFLTERITRSEQTRRRRERTNNNNGKEGEHEEGAKTERSNTRNNTTRNGTPNNNSNNSNGNSSNANLSRLVPSGSHPSRSSLVSSSPPRVALSLSPVRRGLAVFLLPTESERESAAIRAAALAAHKPVHQPIRPLVPLAASAPTPALDRAIREKKARAHAARMARTRQLHEASRPVLPPLSLASMAEGTPGFAGSASMHLSLFRVVQGRRRNGRSSMLKRSVSQTIEPIDIRPHTPSNHLQLSAFDDMTRQIHDLQLHRHNDPLSQELVEQKDSVHSSTATGSHRSLNRVHKSHPPPSSGLLSSKFSKLLAGDAASFADVLRQEYERVNIPSSTRSGNQLQPPTPHNHQRPPQPHHRRRLTARQSIVGVGSIHSHRGSLSPTRRRESSVINVASVGASGVMSDGSSSSRQSSRPTSRLDRMTPDSLSHGTPRSGMGGGVTLTPRLASHSPSPSAASSYHGHRASISFTPRGAPLAANDESYYTRAARQLSTMSTASEQALPMVDGSMPSPTHQPDMASDDTLPSRSTSTDPIYELARRELNDSEEEERSDPTLAKQHREALARERRRQASLASEFERRQSQVEKEHQEAMKQQQQQQQAPDNSHHPLGLSIQLPSSSELISPTILASSSPTSSSIDLASSERSSLSIPPKHSPRNNHHNHHHPHTAAPDSTRSTTSSNSIPSSVASGTPTTAATAIGGVVTKSRVFVGKSSVKGSAEPSKPKNSPGRVDHQSYTNLSSQSSRATSNKSILSTPRSSNGGSGVDGGATTLRTDTDDTDSVKTLPHVHIKVYRPSIASVDELSILPIPDHARNFETFEKDKAKRINRNAGPDSRETWKDALQARGGFLSRDDNRLLRDLHIASATPWLAEHNHATRVELHAREFSTHVSETLDHTWGTTLLHRLDIMDASVEATTSLQQADTRLTTTLDEARRESEKVLSEEYEKYHEYFKKMEEEQKLKVEQEQRCLQEEYERREMERKRQREEEDRLLLEADRAEREEFDRQQLAALRLRQDAEADRRAAEAAAARLERDRLRQLELDAEQARLAELARLEELAKITAWNSKRQTARRGILTMRVIRCDDLPPVQDGWEYRFGFQLRFNAANLPNSHPIYTPFFTTDDQYDQGAIFNQEFKFEVNNAALQKMAIIMEMIPTSEIDNKKNREIATLNHHYSLISSGGKIITPLHDTHGGKGAHDTTSSSMNSLKGIGGGVGGGRDSNNSLKGSIASNIPQNLGIPAQYGRTKYVGHLVIPVLSIRNQEGGILHSKFVLDATKNHPSSFLELEFRLRPIFVQTKGGGGQQVLETMEHIEAELDKDWDPYSLLWQHTWKVEEATTSDEEEQEEEGGEEEEGSDLEMARSDTPTPKDTPNVNRTPIINQNDQTNPIPTISISDAIIDPSSTSGVASTRQSPSASGPASPSSTPGSPTTTATLSLPPSRSDRRRSSHRKSEKSPRSHHQRRRSSLDVIDGIEFSHSDTSRPTSSATSSLMPSDYESSYSNSSSRSPSTLGLPIVEIGIDESESRAESRARAHRRRSHGGGTQSGQTSPTNRSQHHTNTNEGGERRRRRRRPKSSVQRIVRATRSGSASPIRVQSQRQSRRQSGILASPSPNTHAPSSVESVIHTLNIPSSIQKVNPSSPSSSSSSAAAPTTSVTFEVSPSSNGDDLLDFLPASVRQQLRNNAIDQSHGIHTGGTNSHTGVGVGGGGGGVVEAHVSMGGAHHHGATHGFTLASSSTSEAAHSTTNALTAFLDRFMGKTTETPTPPKTPTKPTPALEPVDNGIIHRAIGVGVGVGGAVGSSHRRSSMRRTLVPDSSSTNIWSGSTSASSPSHAAPPPPHTNRRTPARRQSVTFADEIVNVLHHPTPPSNVAPSPSAGGTGSGGMPLPSSRRSSHRLSYSSTEVTEPKYLFPQPASSSHQVTPTSRRGSSNLSSLNHTAAAAASATNTATGNAAAHDHDTQPRRGTLKATLQLQIGNK